jgi:hypothetical protein
MVWQLWKLYVWLRYLQSEWAVILLDKMKRGIIDNGPKN